MRRFVSTTLSGGALLAMLCGCASHAGDGGFIGASGLTPFAKRAQGSSNVPTHVVVIVQENRSVDNLFQQLPGADTQSYGYGLSGNQIPLQPMPLGISWDPEHHHSDFVADFNNGQLNGFDNAVCKGTGCPANFAYSYVEPNDVVQYYEMAESYAFAEHNMQPNEGPSEPGHLYLIAAQTGGGPDAGWYIAENPGTSGPKNCLANANTKVTQINMNSAYPGVEGKAIFPCVDPPTILQEVQAAGLTWKYYTPNLGDLWTAPCLVSAFDCPNNANVIKPQTKILGDISKGRLANVSFVIPSGPDSDHPGNPKTIGGPAWVSAVVDAVGQSQYWNSTAILVVWDDWGGWYDHYLFQPNGHPIKNPTDPYEYGLRVPLLAIGPYAKAGYISAVPRDSTSIVHFIEDVFGLSSLNELDSQTDDLFEMFNFNQSPIVFKPFYRRGDKTIRQYEAMPPDPSEVDSE